MTASRSLHDDGSPRAEESGSGVSRCTISELGELHEFRRSLWGDESRVGDLARTAWLCVQNPAGREDEGPWVWICRREGKIVGTVARIPFPLKVGDEELRSQWGINLIVDPRWRGRGIAAGLIAAASAESRFSCSVGLSEDGTRTAIRNGYTTVGAVPMYVYVLDPSTLLRHRGTSSGWVRAATPLSRLSGAVALSWCRLRSVGFDLVPVDAFDDRADQIWRDASPEYPVIARRDTARLQWRFDESPDRDHYLRFYLLRHGRPVGYVVLRATTWHDEGAIKVVDYLVPTRYLGPLFAHTIRTARDHGAGIMRCRTLNHRARVPLHSLGFIVARSASRTHELEVQAADQDSLRRSLTDPKNWFVTDADSDLD